MSILYDALKKTQLKSSVVNSTITITKKSKKWSWLIISLAALLGLLIAAFSIYYITAKPKPKPQPEKPKMVGVKKPAPLPKPIVKKVNLSLMGVFISDDEKVAMINNRLMHIGDVIEGMKVVSIELEGVKLGGNNTVITLHDALNS